MAESQVISSANKISGPRGGPVLHNGCSLADLIGWLRWNDPNGSYSDRDAQAEGMAPMTRDEALRAVADACG